MDEIDIKCDVFDVIVVNDLGQPILYSFVSDKPPGYRVSCQPESFHSKKINKPVLKTITFFLQDDYYKSVNFNGRTLIFTLLLVKTYFSAH